MRRTEIVGTYATKAGTLVEVGVRPGRVGLRRRAEGFEVVVRPHGCARRRWLDAEWGASLDEARYLARVRVYEHGGVSGSAAGVLCAPLAGEQAREMFAAGLDRYVHVGAARSGRG